MALAALILTCLAPGCGAERRKSGEENATATPGGTQHQSILEQHIEEAICAKDPLTALKAYKRLFGQVEPANIPKLQGHSNHGIALYAAWERVRRSVSAEEQPRGVPVNGQLLHRFAGFVEGRLGVELPRCWEQAVLSAGARQRDNIGFPVPKDCVYQGGGLEFSMPSGTSLQKRGEDVLLEVAGEPVVIPPFVVREIEEGRRAGGGSISALVTRERCYLAAHGSEGPYALFCIDRRSGRPIWKTEVWALGYQMEIGGGPPGPHSVTLVEQDDRVFVFGVCAFYAGIEAFRAKDGAALFRFSTSY
ncbi:MAG: hypothetical protein HY000_08710 [Planctomycetes bacterium]|nr:hypothetical protein [Planctomycetota bacterium]